MEDNFEFSSSEDEFVFEVQSDLFDKISIGSAHDNLSSNSESDSIGHKRKKSRILDSISDLDDVQEKEWVNVAEEDDFMDSINFDNGSQTTGLQLPPTILKPIQFFKLFFTNELVD